MDKPSIKNQGQQTVKATGQAKPAKGKKTVKTGKDLRCGK